MTNNTALLKASTAALRFLGQGVTGWARLGAGQCRLVLVGGNSLRVSVAGNDIASRFECFSLAIDTETMAPRQPLTAFETLNDSATVSVLLRDEYIEPSTGDIAGLVGQPPHMTQTAAKPGQVPESAVAWCLVAYGLLLTASDDAVAILAGWAPFAMEITTDRSTIVELLAESDAMPLDQYIQRFP